MKEWFSARELSALTLPALPTERARLSNFITGVGQDDSGAVRPRSGRGGGLEIHRSALPQAALDELTRRERDAQIVLYEKKSDAEMEADEERKREEQELSHLTARQRAVLKARSTLMESIERQIDKDGAGFEKAVQVLIAAYRAGTLDARQMAIIETANDRRTGLSRATLYAWRRLRLHGGKTALAPVLTRQKAPPPDWFNRFLVFYQRPSKPSVADAYALFCASLKRGESAPPAHKVYRQLAKLDVISKVTGREGKLEIRKRLAYVARDASELQPTSVYIADGKTFDAEIANPLSGGPCRPEITTIVDANTRRIVGWSAGLSENAHTVMHALYRACLHSGIPAIFYTDRGKGYVNKAMMSATIGFLDRAGITPMQALPYNSQAKGVVERINQIYTPAAKMLPTYIGKDMDKSAKLIAFKATRKEIKQTGASRTLPSWQEFLDHIETTILQYNNRPHSTLPKTIDATGRKRPMTPNEYWDQRVTEFTPVIATDADLDQLFRPYVERRVRRCLVEWLGNSYFHQRLEAWEGKKVVMGYDLHDASRVWVREVDHIGDEMVPGRLIAVAEFEGHKTRYVPLSFEQHALEKRAKNRLHRLDGHADAVRKELAPSRLLTASAVPVPANDAPAQPAPIYSPPPAASEIREELNTNTGRPVFVDDVEFALWIVSHSMEVTDNDVAYVRDLLNTPSTNELLRISGVDLEALRSIVRSASGKPEPQKD